ncbi:MAG: tRNA nucleotidyltransferase, partial [Oscillospiraceae bacterium]|nr:tRNA nucleotidyltransferase [Oscillospiraceae bacterium]
CVATGFPISALPVERSLRRAVEHPETEVIPTLALSPQDLMALGLRGPQISAAQKKLALHVLKNPAENTPEGLKKLL